MEALFIGVMVVLIVAFLVAGAVVFVAALPILLVVFAIGLLFVSPGWGLALLAALVFGFIFLRSA